jgi:polyhydroxyalkanoate synthesis repressor PhaR
MADSNATGGATGEPVVIKKYANRRLYNTATSSYVTLDHLCQMVKEGTEFVVRDAKTGEDITHQVLTQIIVEEEAKGQNLLPIGFLRQIIRLYDDSIQALVPRYLELTMENFNHNQERMRSRIDEAFGGMFPMAEFEELGRQNMAAFQKALSMFSPLGMAGGDSRTAKSSPPPKGPESEQPSSDDGDEIAILKGQLDSMQAQLDKLARKAEKPK